MVLMFGKRNIGMLDIVIGATLALAFASVVSPKSVHQSNPASENLDHCKAQYNAATQISKLPSLDEANLTYSETPDGPVCSGSGVKSWNPQTLIWPLPAH